MASEWFFFFPKKILHYPFKPLDILILIWCDCMHARLASLLDVGVGEMCEGEAGDAGRWYGEPGVVWGAGPAGLQHAPCYWWRRGKARRGWRGRSLCCGFFLHLGQEGSCRGGEVIIPLKTTTCRDLKERVRTLKRQRRLFSTAGNIWWALAWPSSSVELSELVKRFR